MAKDFCIEERRRGIPAIRLAILVKFGSVAMARIEVEPETKRIYETATRQLRETYERNRT